MNDRNPFEYEQATTLTLDFVREVFIEDYNFTRFLQSNRNVFLVGERGSGKSMTLLYNALGVQRLKAEKQQKPIPLDHLGIYVPCNTTLTHKREYELIEVPGMAGIISEHFMVLGLAYALMHDLGALPATYNLGNDAHLRDELAYVLGAELPSETSVLDSMMMFIQREAGRSQIALNALRLDEFRQNAFTFSSLVQPLINALRRTPALAQSHFLLLIDDAHDLNPFQKAALNSWVAFRDRSAFSFKIAVADVFSYSYATSSGGTILEGHDFLTIDLQKPFQRAGSDFGKLAREIVKRRLVAQGCEAAADEFFPSSDEFSRDLKLCELAVEKESLQLYPNPTDVKRRNDYVYKYSRARYFRDRADRANLPNYSGFETIVHVSTGVIRNLLMPCYWMYDSVISNSSEEERAKGIQTIPAEVQSSVLKDRSDQLWRWMRSSLSSSIDHCTTEDAKQIYDLFDNLGELFRRRLLTARSEPRAIAFSISGMTTELEALMGLLHIARRAQLLYFRTGPAKEEGRRETYYVPNRLLWPIRGLDVVGQHARVSLKAKDLLAAAKGIPFPGEDEQVIKSTQGGLFDDQD